MRSGLASARSSIGRAFSTWPSIIVLSFLISPTEGDKLARTNGVWRVAALESGAESQKFDSYPALLTLLHRDRALISTVNGRTPPTFPRVHIYCRSVAVVVARSLINRTCDRRTATRVGRHIALPTFTNDLCFCI